MSRGRKREFTMDDKEGKGNLKQNLLKVEGQS